MPNPLLIVCALTVASTFQYTSAVTFTRLGGVFGLEGAVSPIPSNTANYILDLEAQGIYLHYYGDQQIFSLDLSPKLRQYLQSVSSSGSGAMPEVYGIGHISSGVCDWSNVPGWSTPRDGADAQHVFYGREIRNAPGTKYGNAIHLSLDPDTDPEGWTDEEMEENFEFWHAIQEEGKSVGEADTLRSFRNDIASKLGGTFQERWGADVTTKAHRFALQMYTVESQTETENPGSLFFEMFPDGSPPTRQVIFFEAEDGCKGTPTPKTKESSLSSYGL